MSSYPLQILIAEDEPAHAEAICRAIEMSELEAKIMIVDTLFEYRSFIEIKAPDLALLDLNMPDGRAVEILTSPIEEAPFPVLVMTSYGNEKTAVEALKAGALNYVVKSDESFAAMPEIVKRALREWQLVQQRKEVDAALRESEAFIKDILNSLVSNIAVLDENGVIITVNEAWQNFYVDNRAENCNHLPVGTNYFATLEKNLHQRDDPELFKALNGMRSVLDGVCTHFNMEYQCHPAVENRWFYMRVTPLNSQKKGLVIAHADITQLKLAQKRIVHLNQVLRAIRDISQLIMHTKDIQTLITRACELLVSHRSYNSAMIILFDDAGRLSSHAEAGIEDDVAHALSRFIASNQLQPCQEYAEAHDGICHAVNQFETNGFCSLITQHTDLDALCIPLEHDGTRHGFIIVALHHSLAVDQEERTLFKDMAGDLAVALSNLKLGKAIRETEKERDQFEAQLLQSQKMEAIGRLAGGVAHDFNNMLSIISGYGELALERVSPNDPLHDDLKEILAAARRSIDLTKQLLAFARKQTIAPQVLDLNQVVANHERMIKRLVGEDIDLRFFPGKKLWSINMDASQIDQILANFAVNARDAICGVGTITIGTENVVIDQQSCDAHAELKPGEYVRLSFEDSGKGMAQDVLERIFEPFFTTKEKDQGTGLGLSTVYGIVKQNNGFISAYSDPGQGTGFQILFPKYQGAPVEKIKEEYAAVTGYETILVVEDELQILKLTKRMLEKLGYQVLVARLPGEAIITCEKYQEPIDLLITDVVMPDMNGNELKKRIEELKPGIRTLFMSGYTSEVIAHRGVLSNGVSFIQKPFSLKTLAPKVREVLSNNF